MTQADLGTLVFLVSHSSAGGAQEIWANLAEGFFARGFRVKLCALYPYRALVRETAPETPWHYIVDRRPTSPLAQIRMLRRLAQFLRREKPVAVLTAMPAANVLGPLIGRISAPQVPFVLSHHSPVETHNRWLNMADSIVGTLRNVSAVVSVSETVSRSLDGKPTGYRRKRRTIHNALPPRIERHLETLATQRDGWSPEGRRLVATGRLAEQKNYPALLRAARRLPDVTVSIVGSGPDEGKLKRLAAELGVAERVSFLGQKTREEALAVLGQGDIFVQPSLFEGHSLGLIEAAKLALPLVVSNVPVQIEGITGPDGRVCGIAVDPQDDEALAQAVRKLLDDRTSFELWSARASELGSAATFERMMTQYEALIGAKGEERGRA